MSGKLTQDNLYLLLPGKVLAVAEMYARHHDVSVLDAMRMVYASAMYKELEQESTKRWHEGPVSCDGRLLVIDGGFSKVYHQTTGIAGYTLIYNSHGMRLVRHHPFESIQKSVAEGMDVIASTQVVEYTDQQILVRDTDKGKRIMSRVEDLKALLQAYRTGLIRN